MGDGLDEEEITIKFAVAVDKGDSSQTLIVHFRHGSRVLFNECYDI